MRPNARVTILDAAVRLVSTQRGARITLEAAAQEAGVTKPGLMYHFPTKEALMLAVVGHVADRWEQRMLEALGVPFEQASPAMRIRAYVQACTGSIDRGGFSIFADAVYRPTLSGPWVERFHRWFELPPSLSAPERVRLTLARLAADGLWVADSTGVFALAPEDRAALLSEMRSLLDQQVGP